MGLEPIRDTLQQTIAGVPPEGIVDDAQVGDIEHRYLETRQTVGAAHQQPTQPLAEQRTLGKARQRLEIRQEVHRVLLVEVLQGEGQVGGDLLEQQQLVLTDDGAAPGAAQEGADRGVVDAQRQTRERANARGDELVPPVYDMREAHEVRAQYRLPGADDPPHEAGVAGLVIRDRKLLLRSRKKFVARPAHRPCHACGRIDQRQHRNRVPAHAMREPAGLGHDFVAVLNAHQRRVDSREHLQHAGQAGDLPLGSLAGAAQLRLLQRALHGRHQALRVALQDVVDRAALQGLDGALLADGAGKEDEGNPGRFRARNGERRHAIEGGQAEVREDEVRQLRAQRGAHLDLVHDAAERACVAGLLQAPHRQLGVRLGILDQQDAQRPA